MADDLPEGVGPHEGRELELMLRGEKPLTYLTEPLDSPYQPPYDDFEPYVKSGKFIKFEYYVFPPGDDVATRRVFYSLVGEEWRIFEANELAKRDWNATSAGLDIPSEERFGELLGYSRDDIATYVEWIKSRGRTT